MGHCSAQESQVRTDGRSRGSVALAQGLTLSVPQCRLWVGVLLALTLEVGVLLAFLAVQPGQASKIGAATFTF